jgi:acetyl-CoA C-acetyltransferase
MQAAIMGRAAIASGDAEIIIAGGMESMTNAPHMLPTHRGGFKYGHDTIKDHMAQDGLEDAYEFKPMGVFADMIAEEHQFTREQQDAYALETLARAQRATKDGDFKREITPVTISGRKGDVVVDTDELPRKAMPEKIPSLRPAFSKDGTVTAANASAISDGAAALILMRLSEAERRGLKPIARIVATAAHAHEPAYFTTAPVPAMRKVLDKAGWSVGDVDLYELNEAFAAQALCNSKELGIDEAKMNICGGGVAIGHPIGASGARILVTLIHQLKRTGGKKGVAALCLGGGNAVAMCVEMC